MFLKLLQNSQENNFARVTFLIKLQASPQACNFIKKDTGKSVFLWILQKFQEHLFYRTPLVAASVNRKIMLWIFPKFWIFGLLHFWYCFADFVEFRSSCLQRFFRVDVFKNFAIFTGNHLCWSRFLIKLHIKKRLQHRCFPVNIEKCF